MFERNAARFVLLLAGLFWAAAPSLLFAQDGTEPAPPPPPANGAEEAAQEGEDAAAERFTILVEKKIEMLDAMYGKGFFTYMVDDGVMPRPYLLAVEHKENVDRETAEKEFADIFGNLYRVFHEEFGSRIGLKPFTNPVVVLIFDSKDSYKKVRESRPELHLPNEEFMGGFYSPATGVLTQWRQQDLWRVLFHEGTHQLVDVAARQFDVSQFAESPWFQEGFADFMGGHERKLEYSEETKGFVNKFTLGRFVPDRYSAIQQCFQSGEALPLKDLVYYDFVRFKTAQNDQDGKPENQRLTGLIYSEGWALIMFLNYYQEGKYQELFDEYLIAELTGHGGGDTFAQVFCLEEDADWTDLDNEFRQFIFGDLRAMGREHRKKK